MGVPNLEKAPGIKEPWLGIWRATLTAVKETGAWAPALRPLLDEYVYALMEADRARVGFAWLDHLEETVASDELDFVMLQRIACGLPVQWDRHAKRAAALAAALGVTPKARKDIAGSKKPSGEDAPQDIFDELAQRRAG